MSELTDWDITAGNNNSAPPDGWPENTMAYSDVNNTGREGMAVMARYYSDINGSLQAGGTANAPTVTLNSGAAAYFQGMYFACEIGVDNTGAATINVNAIGLKNLINRDGSALLAGQLQAGGIYEFRYDGTSMQLMGTIIGGEVVVTGAELRADINTATPPTTEAVIASYNAFDADGTDQLSEVGFNGSNKLRVKNFMRAGLVDLEGTDSGGVVRSTFSGDPGGIAQLFNIGVATARTTTAAAGGLFANNTLTGGGFERVLTNADDLAIAVDLALKADLASPALTGNPTAPTAAVNDNDTTIATTAFCVAQIADDAPSKSGTGATGTWGISITGTAADATNVNPVDESADTITYLLFVNELTGSLQPKTGTNLNFNSASGILTASNFNGGGASITNLNMANAATGTLATARGGTGVVTSTGSGNNVLSVSPTFTGTAQFTSLQVSSLVNIGSTDTSIGRASAGKIEVENRAVAMLDSTSYESCRITESTGGPSGGANGDIHFEREA